MSQRHFSAVLLLSVIVPLLVSTIILIIVVMVLPNSETQGGSVSQNGQSTGSEAKSQVPSPSQETKSHVLFILGITFASSLSVLLIVIIVVVCRWSRQARGYVVGDQDYGVTNQVYGNADCQLTKHTEKGYKSDHTKNGINTRQDRLDSISLGALPSPPVKTVAVTTQVPPEKRGGGDNCQSFDVPGPDTCPGAQPKSYGTLGRTHLLSSVDEDGYHIDNLGFDPEETSAEQFVPSLGDRQSTATVYQNNFPDVLLESLATVQSSTTEGQSAEGISAAEGDSIDQAGPPQKQLSKQDSFQGLPPQRSFDRYLTLVRLDSDVSLESYSLDETRKIWKSIDEEDEELNDVISKEETDNK